MEEAFAFHYPVSFHERHVGRAVHINWMAVEFVMPLWGKENKDSVVNVLSSFRDRLALPVGPNWVGSIWMLIGEETQVPQLPPTESYTKSPGSNSDLGEKSVRPSELWHGLYIISGHTESFLRDMMPTLKLLF
jgi:hypothetical protein